MISCLFEHRATEVSPVEVYYDIFKLDDNDTIQTSNAERDNYNFKTNPICLIKEDTGAVQHYIMFKNQFDDLLLKAQQSDFAVMNALTYYGKRNKFDYANKMYAMIIDIDLVDFDGLDHYLRIATQDKFRTYPLADYLVLIGGGIHLYFVFEEPISLYPNTKILMRSLKKELTEMLWNRRISQKKKVEIQPLNQPFRILGGKTKVGNESHVPYHILVIFLICQED